LRFYLWDAPKAFYSGYFEGLGNEIIGARQFVAETAKFGYDVGRAGVQTVSLGTNWALGTGVYTYQPSSSLLQGMNAASQQGQGGQYVLNAMANGATLGGKQLVESGMEAIRTGDSTQFSQNAGGFAASVATTIVVTKVVVRCPTAPRASLAGVLEGHPAGQGFTGVFDSATGRIGLSPSSADAVLPRGFVPRAGGHANVSQALGGNAANHSGFAAILEQNGTLRVTWRSGTLNNTPGNLVPENLRPQIIRAIEQQTGRTVSSH